MNTHSVGLQQRRIIHDDIIFAFLAVIDRQTIVHFGSHEEIEPVELRTEHHGNTELHHVAHLPYVVKPISIRGSRIGQVVSYRLEAVCRSGIQVPEIQTGLKEEMSVFQVIGNVQSCSGTAFELLERIALIQRSRT